MAVSDDGNSASQAGVMNPLTGQAGVQSHTPPSAPDKQQPAAAASSDSADQEPQQDQSPQRTRSIFPWWTQSGDSLDQSTEQTTEQSTASVPGKRSRKPNSKEAEPTDQHKAASEDGKQEPQQSGVIAWVKGFLSRKDNESGEQKPMEATPVVVDEVIVPKDLPLDAIAAEVQVSPTDAALVTGC